MSTHPLSQIGIHGRAVVMGVLNVTPDSFSDGGKFGSIQAAIDHGISLRDQGADIIDVGGESTRPGAQRVDEREELDRVIPVIEGLVNAGVKVSIDTMRSTVAREAVRSGATLVNDVSGGLADAAMLPTVAEANVPIVLMHWRAPSDQMEQFTHYDDVVAEVVAHLDQRRNAAIQAGIPRDNIVLDPGLGFAKLAWHNWALLSDLPALCALGNPVLIAASRKRFVGAALADSSGNPRPVAQRDAASHAISALAAANGAWGVRVHEIPGTLDAVKVASEWVEGGKQ